MHLEDFQQHIDPIIVDRGFEYFFDDLVNGPELNSNGRWTATVYGTDRYRVQIQTDPENGGEIIGWQCDCPYDHGPICKHVVAVLFKMDNKLETEPDSSDESKEGSPKGEIRNIFEKTSREDLQKFIQDCIASDDQFENRFIAYFADRLEEDTERRYRKTIHHCAKAAEMEFGFIDASASSNLIVSLQDLNQEAKELFDAGEYVDSITICKVLIEEVGSIYQYIHDYDLEAAYVVSTAFDLLHKISKKASPELKGSLFDWCLKEFPKPVYNDIDPYVDFLTLLPHLISSSEQEQRFFALLDQQIKAVKANDWWSDFQEVRLIKAKLIYFQNQNRVQEVRDLLHEHIRFPEFREQLVERALEHKAFEEAKQLYQKGIEIAEQQNHFGVVYRWQDQLFQIARLENDIPEMRKWAEKLFFDRFLNMDWYRALKATYSKQEWPEKCEQIIDRIKGANQRGRYDDAYALAQIFKEEGYKDRLLKLLQLNARDLTFVDDFATVLKKKYPEELLDMYEQGITEQAAHTGRKHYRQLAAWLRKMKKIKGGDEKAYELYERLLGEYSNRPAMKEELGRIFRE